MTPDAQPPDLSSLGRQIVPDLPDNRLETYARLWQFETWLRRVVYVELRALLGDDWKDPIRGAERSLQADQRLTHMPTPETDPVSYCQLSTMCHIITDRWARYGIADPAAKYGVTVEVLHRPWACPGEAIPGNPGRFYDIVIGGRQERGFDYSRFLQSSSSLHPHLAHICLDRSALDIRVTIPAVLGADRIIEITERLIEFSRYSLIPNAHARDTGGSVDRLAAEWPEYVLGPGDLLSFLAPDMPCAFFRA